MKPRIQRRMTLVRILSTILSVALVIALLSGRTDRATDRFITLTAVVVIALVLLWSWLRERRDRQP